VARWKQVHLQPATGSKFGRIPIAGGKSKSAKRSVSLTERVTEKLLDRRKNEARRRIFSGVFSRSPARRISQLFRASSPPGARGIARRVRGTLVEAHDADPAGGESGADAFTIMRIAGHSGITVSQRYVHPSPELQEKAIARLDAMNEAQRSAPATKPATAEGTATSAAASRSSMPVSKMGA